MKKLFLIFMLLAVRCNAQYITPGYSKGTCSPTAGHTYITTFPLTENPISECLSWLNGAADGTNWSNVQTSTNLAKGTESTSSGVLDDSTAVLKGTWGNDQQVVGTVAAPTYSNSISQEVELRLRTSISSGSITGYEADYIGFTTTNANCGTNVQRWNGALGSFTTLASNGGSDKCLHTGDIIRATMIGTAINVYINDVLTTTTTDSTYSSGRPGVGMYLQGVGGVNNFGFSAFRASDQPIAFVQSKSSLVSTTQNPPAMTITMTSATVTGHHLWCAAFWNDTSRTITSAGDSTNGSSSYTLIGSPVNGAGTLAGWRAQMMYILNITGFATTVHPTVNLSGGSGNPTRSLACHEFQGAGLSTLDQAPAILSQNSTNPAISNTTSTTTSSDEYATGFCVYGNSNNGTTSPWVLRESANFGNNVTGDFEPSKTGAYKFSAPGTSSPDDHLCGIATFK